MKNTEPQQHQIGEHSITEAATAAVHDLQLEAEVKAVCADGDRWCVQFTTGYGQFCDTFRDRFGKENSFELIREKVKRHILKQQQNKIRAGVRIRRGKPEGRPSTDNLFEAAVKTIEGIAGQAAEGIAGRAAGVTGAIISRAARLPETVLTALDDATKAISPVPESGQSRQRAQQPLVRVKVKAAASKSTQKSSRPARKASSATTLPPVSLKVVSRSESSRPSRITRTRTRRRALRLRPHPSKHITPIKHLALAARTAGRRGPSACSSRQLRCKSASTEAAE